MSKTHTGESEGGVTVQIRFIPLKVEDEQDNGTATITVRVNDAQRGTQDNIRDLIIPMIPKLDHEGETFVKNKIKLINTIFEPKGWTKADSLPTRLENMLYSWVVVLKMTSCPFKRRLEVCSVNSMEFSKRIIKLAST